MQAIIYFLLVSTFVHYGYSDDPFNYIPLASNPIRYRSCSTRNNPKRTGSPIDAFHTEIPVSLVEKMQKLFPESVAIPPSLLAEGDVFFRFDCSGVYANVTFLWEGAGYSNLLGYFTFNVINDASGNQTAQITSQRLVFPQVDQPSCMQGPPNATTVTIGPFSKGENLGFYIISNGFNDINGPIFRSVHNPSLGLTNIDGHPHVAIVEDVEFNRTIFGFEDLFNLGDKDYNDVMFSISFSPNCYNRDNFAQSANGTILKCELGAPIITNYLRYEEKEYALLDNSDPNGIEIGCQNRNGRGLYVPDGWEIAPNDNKTREALSCHPWSTECVILSDGVALRTDTQAICATNTLTTSRNDNSNKDCYLPRNCTTPLRILIRKTVEQNDVALPFCSFYLPSQDITNFLNIKGTRFATISNADPNYYAISGGTENPWFELPSGWYVVPKRTNEAELAIQLRYWQGDCVFYGDGNGLVPRSNVTLTGIVRKAVVDGRERYHVASPDCDFPHLLIQKIQTPGSPCCCCDQ